MNGSDKVAVTTESLEAPRNAVSEWKLIMWALVISVWVVLIPIGYAKYQNFAPPEACAAPPSHDAAKDPTLGIVVNLPEFDLAKRETLRKGDGAVLIALSNCSECSLKAIPATVQSEFPGRVVLALSTVPPELPKHLTNLGKNFRFVSLTDDLRTALNSDFLPRLYLIDAESRLVSYQRQPSELGKFSDELARLAKEGKL
ncbi:MAG: hypothetical protein U0R49_01300 [Fimbriimonadales bacterium]